MKVALYSAIYGGYDPPKPLPDDWPDEVPAIMYTDRHDTAAAASRLGWQVRILADPRPTEERVWQPEQAPMMRHKWLKTHPLEAADAEVSLWIDGSLTISVDRYVDRCLDALGTDDAVFVPHPWRDCIYTEADYSATLPRYRTAAIAEQADFYRTVGHPRRWGLIATGANVRRHTDTVRLLGEHWWWECTHRTWQDQLSLPVLLRIMTTRDGFRWNLNMPWAQWWGLTPHGG